MLRGVFTAAYTALNALASESYGQKIIESLHFGWFLPLSLINNSAIDDVKKEIEEGGYRDQAAPQRIDLFLKKLS